MPTEHINIENPDPEDEYSSAQINIEDLANGNQMYVEWGPKGPLLYIYEPEREEPAYVLSLPSEDDPNATLLQTPEWTEPSYSEYTSRDQELPA